MCHWVPEEKEEKVVGEILYEKEEGLKDGKGLEGGIW